jgi:hypothetical protein
LTNSQRAGIAARRVDDARTLDAMHALEAALASAAPGREQQWRHAVLSALAVLDQATADEQHNADQLDSLLSDVARTQPQLRTRYGGVYFVTRDGCDCGRPRWFKIMLPETALALVQRMKDRHEYREANPLHPI